VRHDKWLTAYRPSDQNGSRHEDADRPERLRQQAGKASRKRERMEVIVPPLHYHRTPTEAREQVRAQAAAAA
jgi:hypothetical protein